jgi:hypothetical protein
MFLLCRKFKTMKTFLLIVLTLISVVSYGQRIKLIEGDLNALKGQTSFNTEFTYDNMIVGKEMTEKEYIKDKKTKLDEKEPGRGASWEKNWIDDRTSRFAPQFRELFSKHAGVSVVNEKAPYTLIFKTTRTEPGWNVGVMKAAAYIDAEAWIVETTNRKKIVAKISVIKAPGRSMMGNDFETGGRLQEAYAKAGKELGGFIKKQLKK